MSNFSGAYRRISQDEAVKLHAAGEPVEWAEGCGYIVYDQIALDKFKRESEAVRRPLAAVPAHMPSYRSSGESNNCDQEEGA
jgi:hypothetical protein